MKTIAIAGLLVALAGSAAAQGVPPNLLADANNDGKVSPQEIDAVSNARFPKLDLNGDGYVDRIEAQKLARKVMN